MGREGSSSEVWTQERIVGCFFEDFVFQISTGETNLQRVGQPSDRGGSEQNAKMFHDRNMTFCSRDAGGGKDKQCKKKKQLSAFSSSFIIIIITQISNLNISRTH